MFVMIEVINELTRHVKDLEKLISENPNKKREIKEISYKLSRQMEVMNRLREWRERNRFKVEAVMLGADCQYERKVAEMGTQTIFSDEMADEKDKKLNRPKHETNKKEVGKTGKKTTPRGEINSNVIISTEGKSFSEVIRQVRGMWILTNV